MSVKHLCVCAIETDEYHGYECEITGGACTFYVPNQDACAEKYGEVEHTERWIKEHETK
jgi:hypothetical protein